MKKQITLRALAGLLVVLALVVTAGATSAFVGAKPFFLDAPLRFDYLPSGPGDKPILATDLDGEYVKSVEPSRHAIAVTLQNRENAQRTFSIPAGAALTGANYATDSETLTLTLSGDFPVTADLSAVATDAELSTAITTALAGVSDVTLTGASFAADSQTLTLTLSQGGPVTADLSGLTTAAEVATAITTALAAETDAVTTSADYAADTETLTLNLSEGDPVTANFSAVATDAELSTAITTALAGISDVTLTGASFAADSQTLTLTLSQGGPVTADLSGLSTAAEVATAISTAIAAETDAVTTSADYAADTETLTLTLSEGDPVAANFSAVATDAELSTAITTALAGVSDVTLTGASFAADSQTLTLTLSQGGPVTADLSGLSTAAEVATAISTAIAAETDAVTTSADYAADTETLTLNLSEGANVTADLSGLTTDAELSTAITTALAGVSGVTLTGASFAADSQTLTLTLSQGGPVTADLSGLTTTAEVATAITTALAAETDAVTTSANYTADTETLTLNLSEGANVTADLSDVATDADLLTAVNNVRRNANGIPELLGGSTRSGAPCASFAPSNLTLPSSGWVILIFSAYHNTGTYVNQVAIPSSRLRTLPVKISDTATSATPVFRGVGANAQSFTLNREDVVHLGITTTNRLVFGFNRNFFPCQVQLYTGPAVNATTVSSVVSANYSSTTNDLTLTMSDATTVTTRLDGISTIADIDTAVAAALAAQPRPGITQRGVDNSRGRAADQPVCGKLRGTGFPIPENDWFMLNITWSNAGGVFTHSVTVSRQSLLDIPVAIPDASTLGARTTTNIQSNGPLRNLIRHYSRTVNINLGRTTSGNLAWGMTGAPTTCSIHVLTVN